MIENKYEVYVDLTFCAVVRSKKPMTKKQLIKHIMENVDLLESKLVYVNYDDAEVSSLETV
jgi:hypothetical protein